ncbi:hypothetical protein GGS24DRAFT_498804 [Hypoxylon argillaceum]|nr:hypothetical protein GGS24DRAFT_498804 [Hypoxylon argillaceum]
MREVAERLQGITNDTFLDIYWKGERDLQLSKVIYLERIQEFHNRFKYHITDIEPGVIDDDPDAEDRWAEHRTQPRDDTDW